MDKLKVFYKINNLEIISIMMDSVARQCDCRVKYNSEGECLQFYGDESCKKYIFEKTMSFFQDC